MKKPMIIVRRMPLFVLLLVSQLVYSQQVLIPYRVKDKFGLSDEKGKMIVPAKYDEIEYLKPSYFKFTIEHTSKDSFMTAYGKTVVQDRADNTYGLIKNNKVLIESKAYRQFFVMEGFIIGSKNEYRLEDCMLYDMNGKTLLPEEASAIYIDDLRGALDLRRADTANRLFTILNKLDRRNYLTSIAEYDAKKQVIKHWLLKNARDFKIDRAKQGPDYIFISFNDDNGYHEKHLRYSASGYDLVDAADIQKEKTKVGELGSGVISGGGEVSEISMEDAIAVPPMEEKMPEERPMTEQQEEEMGRAYYTLQKDTLFYIRTKGGTAVQLPTGTTLIFALKQSKSQKGALMFKQQGRFGIIAWGVAGDTRYDSLIYFGKGFIAGKKAGDIYKFGIIDRTGNVVVPFVYDSIPANMKEFTFGNNAFMNNGKSSFILRDKERYETYSNKPYYKNLGMVILVYKDGKCGLISDSNTIILPIEYDMLAENGMNFREPRQEGYVITKKDGKYGAVQLKSNYTTRITKVVTQLLPTLPYVPCFYIDNYSNKNGLRLYGLYNEQTKFAGYANNLGKTYFDN